MNQESDDLHDLVGATGTLSNRVDDLTKRISAKEILAKRTKDLTDDNKKLAEKTHNFAKWAIGGAILALASSILSLAGWVKTGNTVEQNSANAVINCQNANESREANRQAWQLVIQNSSNNGDRTPKQVLNSQKFSDWIDQLYQQRDCHDLSRRYPIPKAPEFEF